MDNESEQNGTSRALRCVCDVHDGDRRGTAITQLRRQLAEVYTMVSGWGSMD